eukprot:176538-Karenia_brevis.AAC.1
MKLCHHTVRLSLVVVEPLHRWRIQLVVDGGRTSTQVAHIVNGRNETMPPYCAFVVDGGRTSTQ